MVLMRKMKYMKLKRVYRRYDEWEEIRFNMWGEVKNKREMLEKAINFTGNYHKYGSYMMRVTMEWPISCENALTDYSINQKAWIGHAAVALAMNCPEDITREAWKHLTYEQQLLANKEADRAIRIWKDSYRKSKNISKDMEEPLLFQ